MFKETSYSIKLPPKDKQDVTHSRMAFCEQIPSVSPS